MTGAPTLTRAACTSSRGGSSACAGSTARFAASPSCAATRSTARSFSTSGGFAPTGTGCPAATGTRASRCSACSSTAGPSPRSARTASASRTIRSFCCSTPMARTGSSSCRAGSWPNAGSWSCAPPTPAPSRAAPATTPASLCRSSPTRSRSSSRWPSAPSGKFDGSRGTPTNLPDGTLVPVAPPPLRATYRLQLTPEFGFAAARLRIPYLRDLGISHLYLSPSLQARAGSTHGYDVVDPTRISEDLGGEREFRALTAAAHAAGLGVVLDLVPNHIATDEANRFWSDPELRRRFFDIDYSTHPPRHRRFFDIDDLAGVRQEDPEVFEATHALALSLVHEGAVDALRIDHPDGLADPAGYLQRLRDRGVPTVWIEKILEPTEKLRDWPV